MRTRQNVPNSPDVLTLTVKCISHKQYTNTHKCIKDLSPMLETQAFSLKSHKIKSQK